MPSSPRSRVASRLVVFGGCVALLVGFLASPLPARAARAARADDVSLTSPIHPFEAVALFDRPDTPYGPGHRGIDLHASVGDQVHSPGAGVVTFAGVVVDRGVVTVAHANGLVSSVEPISPGVTVGDEVRVGDPLGAVSAERSHCAPGACLHWGVRSVGLYVNPLDVLVGYGPVRLLPLTGRASAQSNAPVARSTSRSLATAPVCI